MKKLFMAIFIPVLFILGTPALVATLMYDGTGSEHLPTHIYTDEYNAMEMIFEELDTSMDELEAGTTQDLVYNLDQDIINRAIYEQIVKEINPDYAPGDDCVTDDECYIVADSQAIEGFDLSYRIIGVWVSFYGPESAGDLGRFTLNVYAEIDLGDQLTYKTVLEVHFLFDDDEDYYYLEFDKIQIGRLPLPKSFFTTIMNVVSNQTDLDLESQVGEMPIGAFDLDTISYTLQKSEILGQVAENTEGSEDAGALLAQELLTIIFDNQLINFALVDEEFTLTAGVSQFRTEDEDKTEIPEYLYDLHDSEMVEGEVVYGEFNSELFNPEDYLTDLFTEYIFNSSLAGTSSGFEIDEEIFNKLIYFGAEGFANTRQVQEIEISATETKEIELGLKAIWFEFEEEDIYAKALFRVAGIDSLLVIRAEVEEVPVTVGTETVIELHCTFTEITFGRDDDENSGDYLEILNLEVFKQVFASIGDVEFGEFNDDGYLIISPNRLTSLMETGTEEAAIKVNGISLELNALVLDVEAGDPQLQETLEDFQEALNDVVENPALLTNLQTVLDTTGGGAEQEVYDSVVDLQNTLLDPAAEVEPEQVEVLFDNFTELDEETQGEFLQTFGELIDPDLLAEYGDIFGSFDQEDPGTTE